MSRIPDVKNTDVKNTNVKNTDVKNTRCQEYPMSRIPGVKNPNIKNPNIKNLDIKTRILLFEGSSAMVHTVELIQSLGQEAISDITTSLNLTTQEQDRLFSDKKFQSVRRSLNSHEPETGIKNFAIFRRDDNQTGYPAYYATVEIEPLVMIEEKLTVDLFQATPVNVLILRFRFRAVMSRYFNHESLINLQSWQCRRIDYTFNFRFNNAADKDLFLELTRKTSRHVRKQPRRVRNLALKRQSTAEGNNSVKVIFYDKRKQIDEVYNDIPSSQKQSLLESADNLIRFEVQCLKGRVSSLRRKHRFPDRSILHYLNEDIAKDVLILEYRNSVGLGDFYSFYWAKKRIERSSFFANKKQSLVRLLQLIAQARHVSIAKEHFRKGTKIKRTDIIVQGSVITFESYLRDLNSLGINPMLIPKERKITHFTNPIVQLLP